MNRKNVALPTTVGRRDALAAPRDRLSVNNVQPSESTPVLAAGTLHTVQLGSYGVRESYLTATEKSKRPLVEKNLREQKDRCDEIVVDDSYVNVN